jgi:uncharacterized protein YjbJ (UPF0337 family)
MASDVLKGQWKQIRGRVKAAWGKLTDDEIDEINGNRDMLLGKLQKEYGYNRMEAEEQVNDFLRKLDQPS